MITEFCKQRWILGGCSGRMITTPSGYIGDGFIADVDTKENAQRIVDCVNACASIDNPKRVMLELDALRAEVDRLKAELRKLMPIEARGMYAANQYRKDHQ